MGHDVGDKLLIFFADTLQQVMRNEDIVARLGGDEFTILISSLQSDDSLGEIADRIHLK